MTLFQNSMFLFYFIIFILGLAVGSFLNVVIFRLENGGKIINSRSKCLHCGHILAWYDLIPVLSFIFLKGKCRYCRRSISWQYLAVELSTAILFVVLMSNFKCQISNEFPIFNIQFLISIFYYFFITSVLIVIFVYDLKHYIIPDKVIYPAIGITFIYRLFEILDFGHWDLIGIIRLSSGQVWDLGFGIFNPFLFSLFAAFISGLFFYSIVIITRGNGMGGGDVKLAFLMGLILGWPMVAVAVFLAFILGSAAGICLILARKKKMKSAIPFGPFLAIGAFVALFWGEGIVRWYLSIIG